MRLAPALLAACPLLSVSPATAAPALRAVGGGLPLRFEANQGQLAEAVRFFARAPGYQVHLTAGEAVLVLPPASTDWEGPAATVVRLSLEGANPAPAVRGVEPLPGVSHYYRGRDPAAWRTGVVGYARVEYRGVYPGIDLVYYGTPRRLEFDLVVAPGADPGQIRLAVEGASAVSLGEDGALRVATAVGELRLEPPAGVYRFFIALLRAGALADGVLELSEIGAAAIDTVTFGP